MWNIERFRQTDVTEFSKNSLAVIKANTVDSKDRIGVILGDIGLEFNQRAKKIREMANPQVLVRTAAIAGSAALLVIALSFVDQGSGYANAADGSVLPTATPDRIVVTATPTSTPTPDLLATARAIVTATAAVPTSTPDIRTIVVTATPTSGPDVIVVPPSQPNVIVVPQPSDSRPDVVVVQPPPAPGQDVIVVRPEIVKPEVVQPQVIIVPQQLPGPTASTKDIDRAVVEELANRRLTHTAVAAPPTQTATPTPTRTAAEIEEQRRIVQRVWGFPWDPPWGIILGFVAGLVVGLGAATRETIVERIHPHHH